MQEDAARKIFTDAYGKYFDAIYRHCYFRVFDHDLAGDIAQETFIKTWKYIADGGKVQNMKAFLYKISGNLVIDHSRKKKTASLDSAKESALSIRLNNSGQKALDKLEAEEIKSVIMQLDETFREPVMLRYIEELKPKEIAQVLGINANTVSVRIYNGVKMLRKILKEKYNKS